MSALKRQVRQIAKLCVAKPFQPVSHLLKTLSHQLNQLETCRTFTSWDTHVKDAGKWWEGKEFVEEYQFIKRLEKEQLKMLKERFKERIDYHRREINKHQVTFANSSLEKMYVRCDHNRLKNLIYLESYEPLEWIAMERHQKVLEQAEKEIGESHKE